MNKNLEDDKIYQKWSELGFFNHVDVPIYDQVVVSHQMELCAIYLLSVEDEPDEYLNEIANVIIPILIRIYLKDKIIIDPKTLYNKIKDRYDKEEIEELQSKAYFAIDVEAELIAMITEEIVKEYEKDI